MISGAKHIPMGEIPNRLDEIPRDQEVVFICRSRWSQSTRMRIFESPGLD